MKNWLLIKRTEVVNVRDISKIFCFHLQQCCELFDYFLHEVHIGQQIGGVAWVLILSVPNFRRRYELVHIY